MIIIKIVAVATTAGLRFAWVNKSIIQVEIVTGNLGQRIHYMTKINRTKMFKATQRHIFCCFKQILSVAVVIAHLE